MASILITSIIKVIIVLNIITFTIINTIVIIINYFDYFLTEFFVSFILLSPSFIILEIHHILVFIYL